MAELYIAKEEERQIAFEQVKNKLDNAIKKVNTCLEKVSWIFVDKENEDLGNKLGSISKSLVSLGNELFGENANIYRSVAIKDSNIEHNLANFETILALLDTIKKLHLNPGNEKKEKDTLNCLKNKVENIYLYIEDIKNNPERLRYLISHIEISDEEQKQIEKKKSERLARETEEAKRKMQLNEKPSEEERKVA